MNAPSTPSVADDGEPLVTALTRPAMVGGFTLTSLGMSLYFPGMLALITRSLGWTLAMGVLLLAMSYLVCLKDVYLFGIGSAWTHLKACPNKQLWGCRRYAPR